MLGTTETNNTRTTHTHAFFYSKCKRPMQIYNALYIIIIIIRYIYILYINDLYLSMNYDYKLHIIIRNHKRSKKQQNKMMIIYKPVLQKYPHRLLISRHHPPTKSSLSDLSCRSSLILPLPRSFCFCFQDSLSLPFFCKVTSLGVIFVFRRSP